MQLVLHDATRQARIPCKGEENSSQRVAHQSLDAREITSIATIEARTADELGVDVLLLGNESLEAAEDARLPDRLELCSHH